MKKQRNASAVAAEQLSKEFPKRATLVVQIHHNPHPTRGINYAWENLPRRYQSKMRLELLRVLKALDTD
jgi:hypothetical protein